MKERPILFTSDMVTAILEGRKTETRRVIKPQFYESLRNPPQVKGVKPGDLFVCPDLLPTGPVTGRVIVECESRGVYHNMGTEVFIEKRSPYGKRGDRLYVRETFYHYGHWAKNGKTPTGAQAWTFKRKYGYDGDGVRLFDNPPAVIRPNKYRRPGWYKRPSIFMPRWASRLLLGVTEVKVERVQEIDDAGAEAEGAPQDMLMVGEPDFRPGHTDSYKKGFTRLWDSINKKRGYSWESNPWVWVVKFKVIEKRGE